MANSLGRRAVLGFAALAASASALPAEAEEETGEQHMARMMGPPPADAPKVVMLIHPKMAALDLIGPMTVLTIRRCNVRLVWKNA